MFTTPGLTAVTRPVVLTVAMPGLPLVQEPPEGVAVKRSVYPRQMPSLPVMMGPALTVIVNNE